MPCTCKMTRANAQLRRKEQAGARSAQKSEKRCAARAAEEKLAREGKMMQDKAVEKRYGSISLDEFSKVGARVACTVDSCPEHD